MKHIRRAIHILMILPVLAVGLPSFCPEDASRDHAVNLQDAILHVKNVVGSAERPAQFGPSVKRAISAFQIVAELDERITPSKDASPTHADTTFLIPSGSPVFVSADATAFFGQTRVFETITTQPATPPPEHA